MSIEHQSDIERERYWQQHIEQYNARKQSKVKCCKKNDLIYHRFLYWVIMFSEQDDTTDEANKLLPIKIKSSREAINPIATIELNKDVKILIHDSATLVKLVREFN